MSNEDIDNEFRRMADTFIDLANKHADTINPENVSMALLFAASRYNAFIVASHSENEQQFEAERERAHEFFSTEYARMFNENFDDYKKVFDESAKYEHLVKKH